MQDQESLIGWMLVVVGLVIVGVGLLWTIAPTWLRPGSLPGDLVFEGRHTRVYFPIATCLVFSVVLSLVLWLARWVAR